VCWLCIFRKRHREEREGEGRGEVVFEKDELIIHFEDLVAFTYAVLHWRYFETLYPTALLHCVKTRFILLFLSWTVAYDVLGIGEATLKTVTTHWKKLRYTKASLIFKK
jgi:hypothetical protein